MKDQCNLGTRLTITAYNFLEQQDGQRQSNRKERFAVATYHAQEPDIRLHYYIKDIPEHGYLQEQAVEWLGKNSS